VTSFYRQKGANGGDNQIKHKHFSQGAKFKKAGQETNKENT